MRERVREKEGEGGSRAAVARCRVVASGTQSRVVRPQSSLRIFEINQLKAATP